MNAFLAGLFPQEPRLATEGWRSDCALLLHHDAREGPRLWVLEEALGTHIIGSSPEARVRIENHELAAAHCALEYRDAHWQLRDLLSRQGTFYAGLPISTQPLEHGAHFRAGRATLRVFTSYSLNTLVRHALSLALDSDPLTSALTRTRLFQTLPSEVLRATRHGRPLSVLLCDVRGLRTINSSQGHLLGDLALVRVSESLRRTLDPLASLYRWSGNAFLVLAPETTNSQALALAHALSTAVATSPLNLPHDGSEGRVIPLAVSIGVSTLSASITSPEQLLELAEDALQDAKSLNPVPIATRVSTSSTTSASEPS